MTAVLPTLGDNGLMPPMWSAAWQQMNSTANVSAGAALNTTRFALDQWQNCTYIQGALNQVVTVGAAFGQYGVQVGTNLPGFGAAVPQNLATTHLAISAGSTTGTLVSGTGFVNGYVVGAIVVSSTNVVTQLFAGSTNGPTTTYVVSGVSITFSQPAQETVTHAYCASVLWVPVS